MIENHRWLTEDPGGNPVDRGARGESTSMKFQIWNTLDEREPIYAQALSEAEVRALKMLGYEMVHEFEAVSRKNAEAYFVAWCDNRSD